MPVRAVTPRIPALQGLVHWHNCPGDCCNYDAAQDLRVTGEDIFSSEWPDRPLRLNRTTHLVTGELRTASHLVESRPRVHASSPTKTGRDGRGSAPTTSPVAPADCSGSNATGGSAPLLPAEPPKPLEDVSGARRSPGAA